MNPMTDLWAVFGRDQGQIVERAYRYDPDRDRIVRRILDRSSGRARYESAPCPEGVEWTGSEGVAPFNADTLEWGEE